MITGTLTIAICLSAVLAASSNVAHAGFVTNTAKLGKAVVINEKAILKAPMSARERLGLQAQIGKGAVKCFVKGATRNPCLLP